jgi:glycosyltransferase involved in cell wall biosynthesis
MSKIKILYIITKLELGGAQKQLLELIRNLDKDKYTIFLFTAREGILIKDAESIPCLKIKKSIFLERPINPLRDIFALIEIYLFIRKIKPQIVHTHSSKAGILGRLASRFAKVKIIIHTVHGWSFNDYQFWLLRWFFIGLERLTAQFTTRLIVVSHYDRDKGLRNKIGTEDKYVLIHYGINYEDFDIEPDLNLKKELKIDQRDLVVGMIACFKPQKGIFDFIKSAYRVAQEFPQVKFLLVGDGILRPKIEKLIIRFKIEDKFILTGWRRDIPKILSIMDIFVLTSLWEGLPIVVLEAKASKKPVVATDTGGIREIIKNLNDGFLVNRGKIEEIAQRIILLLKDKRMREKIKETTKFSLDHRFSLSQMLKDTDGLYNQLLKERG